MDETGVDRDEGDVAAPRERVGFRRGVRPENPIRLKILGDLRATPPPSRALLPPLPQAPTPEKIEAMMPAPRPDPELLRELIAETRKSNVQNEQIIAQNDQLLEGARSGSKVSGWNLAMAIVAAVSGVVAVVIALIALAVS